MTVYWDTFAQEYVKESDLEVCAPPERYYLIKDKEGTIAKLQDMIYQATKAIKLLAED